MALLYGGANRRGGGSPKVQLEHANIRRGAGMRQKANSQTNLYIMSQYNWTGAKAAGARTRINQGGRSNPFQGPRTGDKWESKRNFW